MRRWIVALVLLGGLMTGRAQSIDAPVRLSKPEVRATLVSVVTAQLAAFRADDWDQAYACASRVFRTQVPQPKFVTLISKTYPVVWKNTRAEFGLPSDNGKFAVVPVRVFSPGKSEPYNWLLVKEGDAWFVTGVVPQPTAGGA